MFYFKNNDNNNVLFYSNVVFSDSSGLNVHAKTGAPPFPRFPDCPLDGTLPPLLYSTGKLSRNKNKYNLLNVL